MQKGFVYAVPHQLHNIELQEVFLSSKCNYSAVSRKRSMPWHMTWACSIAEPAARDSVQDSDEDPSTCRPQKVCLWKAFENECIKSRSIFLRKNCKRSPNINKTSHHYWRETQQERLVFQHHVSRVWRTFSALVWCAHHLLQPRKLKSMSSITRRFMLHMFRIYAGIWTRSDLENDFTFSGRLFACSCSGNVYNLDK